MRCDICGQEPCQTVGFCGYCREFDAQHKPEPTGLPRDWDNMSLGQLYDTLNDPDRLRPDRAAQSTYDAVEWSLIYNNGLSNPQVRDANLRRLGQFSERQLNELIAALERKKIAPEVIAAIRAMRHE